MQSRAEAAFICAHVRLDFEVVSDEKQRKRKENRKEKEKKKKKKKYHPSVCYPNSVSEHQHIYDILE